MLDQFEITSFLRNVIDSAQEGRVHLVGNNVEWCLDIVEGRLVFAAHSLQYLSALETILPDLGYEAALPIYWRLIRSDRYKRQSGDQGLEALSWTSRVVGALVQYGALSLEQAEKTLAKLAEDAVDSLLGLETATVVWHGVPQGVWYVTARGVYVSALLNRLLDRRQAWQPLCDRIVSPHQRPYCETPDTLHQSVPKGIMSPQMLESLVRLMQGASIRQLAQTVKQDDITLAKLLYPYIQHQVIKLWPPVQPFDRLPWLPSKKLPVHSTATVPATAANKSVSSHTNGLEAHNQVSRQPFTSHRLDANTPPSSTQNWVIHNPIASNVSSGNGNSSNGNSSNGNSNNGSSGGVSSGNGSSGNGATPKASQSRYLIICIDDSQAMLEKIDSYLDPERFELKTIIDPVASVAKICAMKPDLVLMDVSMPNINGNSLCQILKRSYMFKDVPIIMISSNASPLNKATAQSAGATDYLEKPFSKAQLMRILETYLETQFAR